MSNSSRAVTRMPLLRWFMRICIQLLMTISPAGSWDAGWPYFPQSAIQNHPILIVADVYHRAFHWDLQGMRQLLDHAEGLLPNNASALSRERRRSLKTDIDVLWAFCLYWLGDVETALQKALRALSVVPKEHRFAQHLAIVYAAVGYAICGRRNEALKILSEAFADDVATGSRNVSQFLAARAAIEYWAGNLEAVERKTQMKF